MRSKLLTALTVIGALTVLVLAGNTVALATTGKAILAGKINTANKPTTISRTTPGTALAVKTKQKANAPFAVNGTGKVTNLNVDKVDGFDGGTRVLTWSYTGPVTGDRTFTLGGLPKGTYLLSYEVFMSALNAADGTQVNCFFRTASGTIAYGGETSAVQSTDVSAPDPSLSGTALMVQPAANELSLYCNVVGGGTTWSANANQPVRITAIPIAGVTNKGTPLNPLVKLSARK